jgi:integrase
MSGDNTLPNNVLVVKAAKAKAALVLDKATGERVERRVTTEYKIDGVPGLALVVQPSGRGTYFVRYQIGSGATRKQLRVRIGDRKLIDLKDAKSEALSLMAGVSKGQDPAFEKATKFSNISLSDLVEQFEQIEDRLAPQTRADYVYALQLDILPTLGVLAADQITKAQLAAQLLRIKKDSDWAADKAQKALVALYRFGRGKALTSADPVNGLDFRFSGRPRERVATEDELKALWQTIDHGGNLGPAMRTVLKLAILTGQRIGQVVAMEVRELELQPTARNNSPDRPWSGPKWRISRQKMKVKKRDQLVPLSRQAAKIIEVAVKSTGAGFVFPADFARVKPGQQPRVKHLARDSATTAMARVCEKIGLRGAVKKDVEGKPLTVNLGTTRHGNKAQRLDREETSASPLTIHDMRTALITWLRETHHERDDACDAILHHARHGTTGRHYDMSTLEGPVRIALQAWADHIEQITQPVSFSPVN